jgi:hypothetical protein
MGFFPGDYRNKRKKDDLVFLLSWNEDNEMMPVCWATRGVLLAAAMR